MRLIDADALIHKLKTAIELGHRVDRSVGELKAVLNDLESMPTIDALPVIRCKDCKWYGRADKRRFYRGADCLQGHLHTTVPDRDYCSRAEPKEDTEA